MLTTFVHSMQQGIIAVQADCADPIDIPQRTYVNKLKRLLRPLSSSVHSALLTFVQLIGGTIGISIANTVFTNKLQSTLAVLAPNAPLAVIRSVEAIKLVPEAQRTPIIQSYAIALNYVFIIGELCFFFDKKDVTI